MAKFTIHKQEKEVISMRIPLDILKQLDDMASENHISRNELINQMILFSLEHLDKNEDSD